MEAVEKITAETGEAETGVAKPLLETSFPNCGEVGASLCECVACAVWMKAPPRLSCPCFGSASMDHGVHTVSVSVLCGFAFSFRES